jgi:hypothetical protein
MTAEVAVAAAAVVVAEVAEVPAREPEPAAGSIPMAEGCPRRPRRTLSDWQP